MVKKKAKRSYSKKKSAKTFKHNGKAVSDIIEENSLAAASTYLRNRAADADRLEDANVTLRNEIFKLKTQRAFLFDVLRHAMGVVPGIGMTVAQTEKLHNMAKSDALFRLNTYTPDDTGSDRAATVVSEV